MPTLTNPAVTNAWRTAMCYNCRPKTIARFMMTACFADVNPFPPFSATCLCTPSSHSREHWTGLVKAPGCSGGSCMCVWWGTSSKLIPLVRHICTSSQHA
eukprot:1159049-Pelagomonas_calceolata.AAC.6